MRVAVRIIELAGSLQFPADLHLYDGVRIYYSVRGQIKGYTTLWNNHKSFARLRFRYPANYGSWLPLLDSFFSPHGRVTAHPENLKMLFCNLLGLATDGLDEPYEPLPLDLPPLSASIVIPTKDRPAELTRALARLVTHQTRVPHEIIVVDNNPVSGLTRPVVAGFPGVRYLTQTAPGVGYARNAGTLAARGDVVISTDDDVVVAEGWLDQMIVPFGDPAVGAVMGLVLPYELNSQSQELFEETGGLNLGYEARYFNAGFFDQPIFPDIGKVGNTSSAAFRYTLFADPRVGPFDVALGSGTPARGGGDIYQFYRVLAAGQTSVYWPAARVFHEHRRRMSELRKQLISFESGYTAMLWRVATSDKDRRVYPVLRHYLPLFQLGRLRHSLAQGRLTLTYLTLLRMWGNLIGPFNLGRSLRRSRKLQGYTAHQFAQWLARREPLTPQDVLAPQEAKN